MSAQEDPKQLAAFLALISSVLQNERALRADSDEQAEQNAELLDSLRERQVLLERLAQLQRGIVDRLPVHEVLEAVVEGACELLDSSVGILWIADPDDPDHAAAVAALGGDDELMAERRRKPAGAGLGGRAMRERMLVVADAVTGAGSLGDLVDFPVAVPTAAMAAPVYERSHVVGSLGVASTEPGRLFGARDQQVLISLAEHASLALNHARAVEEDVHEALHDSLTGLPNRSLFLDRMRHALDRAERESEPVAVLFCDLDGFKTVNDSLGHRTGDRLLVMVAERLSECLRPGDTIARLGGDEFAVLLEELREPGDAARAAQRLLDALEAPFELRDREFYVSVSIGIAAGKDDAETLLRDADLAMYRAKSRGKGRYAVFEPGMHTAIVERLELEVDLKRALEREELVVVYQPIFSLVTGSVTGVEALVRWRHPTRGIVMPESFVPLAEESGLIGELGRWVLRKACHQGALWRAKYPGHPGLGDRGERLRRPASRARPGPGGLGRARRVAAGGHRVDARDHRDGADGELRRGHRGGRCPEGAGRRPRDRRLRHRLLLPPLPPAAAPRSDEDREIVRRRDRPARRGARPAPRHHRPRATSSAYGSWPRGSSARSSASGCSSSDASSRRAICSPSPSTPPARMPSCSASACSAGRPERQATRRRARRLRSSDRSIVARIESYSPGRIVIDGVEHHTDVIVLPDRVLGDWWRRDGHSLVIEDLDDVLEELPQRLILGCGYAERLQPERSVIEALRERGVKVEPLPTDQAVERFEELEARDPAAVAAALHLTC